MTADDALFEPPKAKPAKAAPVPAGGALYQSVSAGIRALFPKDDPKAKELEASLEGHLGIARALARRIDADPRASVGVSQCAVTLRDTLNDIREACSSGDAFDKLLEELNRDDTPAPHRQV